MKRYSDRKGKAKKIFKSKGGYEHIERARAYHPDDMPYDNWLRTIDGFRDQIYIKKSEANKQVREKQHVTPRVTKVKVKVKVKIEVKGRKDC